MHRVVILGCSKAKLQYPEMASRIYTGVIWSAWRAGMSIRVSSKELQPCSKLYRSRELYGETAWRELKALGKDCEQ